MLKSKWMLFVALICILPLAAHATITRVIGLGGQNTEYMVKDASNPQGWPQLISDWPNLAGAEFYEKGSLGWDFHKAYVNFSLPNSSVVQVSLDNVPGVSSMFFGNAPYTLSSPTIYNLDSAATNANKLSLCWGMPWNGMKVGAALNIAQHSYEDKLSPAHKMSTSLIGINLGGSFLDNKLDAAVGFETVSTSLKPGDTGIGEDKSDGSMAINLAARYWWMYNETMAFIPNLRILSMKDGITHASGDKESAATTDIKLGIGYNWNPVENSLALFELGADIKTTQDKSTSAGAATTVKLSSNSLPYWRIGFETRIFTWLTGRLGAERSWASESSDEKPAQPSAAYSQTATYLGATACWNRLFLDVQVSPGFFNNGPYFISGSGSGGMFSRVSLKYNFSK